MHITLKRKKLERSDLSWKNMPSEPWKWQN